MLKNFQKYFYETSKVYEFKVKIANCDLTKEVLESIKNAIDAYQVESVSAPKRLPIQEHREFGNLGPCECCVIDIAVKYPTIAEQIRQLVISRAQVNADCVFVYTKDQYLQEEEVTARIIEQGANGPVIKNPELKADAGGQELVGEKRISSFMKELNDAKHRLDSVYEIDGTDTNNDSVREKSSKKGETTNTAPMGNKSPVGSNKQAVSNPMKGR
jgi:hypothetical protein